MEPESSASKARRRTQSRRHSAIELAIAAAFVGAVFIGDRIAESGAPSSAMKILAAGLPIAILTIWWAFYAAHIKALGEFERNIATQSLAIACGVTLWITTAWGLIILFAGAPALPLAMVAPLAALIYAVIRAIFTIRYR